MVHAGVTGPVKVPWLVAAYYASFKETASLASPSRLDVSLHGLHVTSSQRSSSSFFSFVSQLDSLTRHAPRVDSLLPFPKTFEEILLSTKMRVEKSSPAFSLAQKLNVLTLPNLQFTFHGARIDMEMSSIESPSQKIAIKLEPSKFMLTHRRGIASLSFCLVIIALMCDIM